MTDYRCGSRAQLGDGTALFKLPTNRPLYYVQDDLPGFDRDDIAEYLEVAMNDRWGSVCDFKIERTDNPSAALWIITVADLGGSGVLADQQLPYRGARHLTMRINSRIQWVTTDGPMPRGRVDLIRVLGHEGGHFMGSQHFPRGAPPEWMEPYVSNTIIRPQPTESELMVRWFGHPVVSPSPTPEPGEEAELVIKVKHVPNQIIGVTVDGVEVPKQPRGSHF